MTSQTSFGTLSEFLLQAGTEYFVIDVSRTRRFIDNQTFFDYETNKMPYASPRQGNAWLCVVFWNKQLNQDHYMWFLKLPIDEQSLLMQAARDQFLHIVTEALGQQLQNINEKRAQLPENPFVFIPNQQLLADVNAMIRHHLNISRPEGAGRALNYLKAPNIQAWSELSVQDISDLAITVHNEDVQAALLRHLEILPHPVCVCLCSSFEGIELPSALIDAILDYHQRCEQSVASMLLRSLASSRTTEVDQYIRSLVSGDEVLDTETLIVIAGRHWQALSPEAQETSDSLSQYFEKVAIAEPTYALFRGIFADMVQIPALRVFLLAMIRDQRQSEMLKSAISTLFDQRHNA
ncbi:DUF3549 family protein [Glaciecola sp. SC05]|uniref:DUF3549 family protein n=1 Tax=Glaciecola sp. SC05 TaxID=1987355 RepID=UPI0035289F7D